MNSINNQIVVLDFGGQYSHLITRRIRDMGVSVQLISAKEIRSDSLDTKGLILSGGPRSVGIENGNQIPLFLQNFILNSNIPILGICYGHQLLGDLTGGQVQHSKHMEYGREIVKIVDDSKILPEVSSFQTWMSHGDTLEKIGSNFIVTGITDNCPVAVMEHKEKNIFGVQFHPEVTHTEFGNEILKKFVLEICEAKFDSWKIEEYSSSLIEKMKKEIGSSKVLLGVSGGVDSTVAALVLHDAIGSDLHCVFIDHGLLRKNERKEVENFFEESMKFKNFLTVDASRKFLQNLKGISDPEEKRKIIGHTFIEVFEGIALQLEDEKGKFEFLAQGTIYSDRIESGAAGSDSSKIKSHHNLTLPKTMGLQIIEPLKDLYKDEIRKLGKYLGVPNSIIKRYPFPGPGLAVRIIGEVTKERLRILRIADDIFTTEITKAGIYDLIWQGFAVLLTIKSVGVKGDNRAYGNIIALRAVQSTEGMTADFVDLPWEFLGRVATKIINSLPEITRVVYDVSTKPPATIEFE